MVQVAPAPLNDDEDVSTQLQREIADPVAPKTNQPSESKTNSRTQLDAEASRSISITKGSDAAQHKDVTEIDDDAPTKAAADAPANAAANSSAAAADATPNRRSSVNFAEDRGIVNDSPMARNRRSMIDSMSLSPQQRLDVRSEETLKSMTTRFATRRMSECIIAAAQPSSIEAATDDRERLSSRERQLGTVTFRMPFFKKSDRASRAYRVSTSDQAVAGRSVAISARKSFAMQALAAGGARASKAFTSIAPKFSSAMRKQDPEVIRKSKLVEKQVKRLWRMMVANDVLSTGGWTLEQYMDYHLSLYCYLESRDGEQSTASHGLPMIDSAWESALQDWQDDTAGRARMTYEAFFDSVFELTTVYAEEEKVKAYVDFLKELIEGTTTAVEPASGPSGFSRATALARAVKAKQGPERRLWKSTYPKLMMDPVESKATVEALRMALLGPKCYEMSKSHDAAVRKSAERMATVRLKSWCEDHGTVVAEEPHIGTPAELLVAMMQSQASEKNADIKRGFETALSWISTQKQHEIETEEEVGRLIAVFKFFDAEFDGRITYNDLVSALIPANTLSSGSKGRGAARRTTLVGASQIVVQK